MFDATGPGLLPMRHNTLRSGGRENGCEPAAGSGHAASRGESARRGCHPAAQCARWRGHRIGPGGRSADLPQGSTRRRRLDGGVRHHRGRGADPHGTRLPAGHYRAFRAGHVRVDEERRHGRVPRELAADPGADAEAVPGRRLDQAAAREPRRCKVHAGRAGLPARRGSQGLRGHQQIQKSAGGIDLRHRARQRRQRTDPRHDQEERIRPGRIQGGGIERAGHARAGRAGRSRQNRRSCSSRGRRIR